MRLTEDTDATVVGIAGATGFVGGALRTALAQDYRLVGLTRSPERRADDPNTTWRGCDLFSLLEVERALEGVDVAIYLVHSMMPSARLTQGDFADLDLLLADNFARAAAKAGVRQILYVGGLLPEDGELSPHLRSRLEVERTLGSHGVPVTSLRAGLIVGPGGSSLQILVNLVRRLPAMVTPHWTATPTQPIALRDVVRAVAHCIDREETFGQAFDIGGPEVMTYREMMRRTAAILGTRRVMVPVPWFSPRLSILWVCLFASAPRELVGPLVESLRHEMRVRDNPVQQAIAPGAIGFEASLRAALADEQEAPSGGRRSRPTGRTVRSVQRLTRPGSRTAEWVAREYIRWLPAFVRPLLGVRVEGERVGEFRLFGTDVVLLELTRSVDRSTPDRQLYYVTGGVLARLSDAHRGRLEFREVLGGEAVLAAVHDFEPRLPWLLYVLTQAQAHLWVMRGFGRHLESQPA